MKSKVSLYLCCAALASFSFANEDLEEDLFAEEEHFIADNGNEDRSTPSYARRNQNRQRIYVVRKRSVEVADNSNEYEAEDEESEDSTPVPSEEPSYASAGNNQYHRHYSIYGDFLYWQPVVDDSYWGLKSYNPFNTKEYRFHFDWDVGFRIGTAFKTTWEELVLDLNWTRFHTTSTNNHEDVSRFGTAYGSYPKYSLYSLPFDDFSFGNPWRAKAKYTINFDQIDLSVRKPLFFRKNFTLSPFIGVRALLLNYHLNSTRYSTNYGPPLSTPDGPQDTSHVDVSDMLRTIGLLAGVNANLEIGYGFGFYVGGDFFIGYGPDKSKNTSYQIFQGVREDDHILTSHTNTMRTMFDIITGFSWDRSFFKDKFNLLFSAGYEFHVLNNAPLFLYNGSSTGPDFSNEPSKTTAFQGLTVRGGVSF